MSLYSTILIKLKLQTSILLKFNSSKEAVQIHTVARKFRLATAKSVLHQDKYKTKSQQVVTYQPKTLNQLYN